MKGRREPDINVPPVSLPKKLPNLLKPPGFNIFKKMYKEQRNLLSNTVEM